MHKKVYGTAQKTRQYLIALLLKVYSDLRKSNYDIRQTIIVASSPRGGSTWLAELISTLPGSQILWEPLHPGNNPICKQFGFTWQNYPSFRFDSSARQQQYMYDILTGADLSTRLVHPRYFDALQIFYLRRYIIKFVNANMILSWILELFPVRAILMLRHPCAVVSSQMLHGAWSSITRDSMPTLVPQKLLEDYPYLKPISETLHSLEELLAFFWAIQNLIPLQKRDPAWLLTTYERMVTHGNEEILRLFNYLDEPIPKTASLQLRKPSSTTKNYSNVAQGRDPLTGWRSNLTAKQIDLILATVHNVGITCYTEDYMPQL